ncbi:polyprenyl synthetase family protein [Metabacillus idriensis]|uniref:polyprenyl synthetase family protein n=1 Tax=Metabacillus idriensis TaxID=324768 RepID=UPI00174CB8D1|nr:polyprenyl synthetase family protein [Metabacillus idriensis]
MIAIRLHLDYEDLIQSLKAVISSSITNKELLQLILSFAETKKTFPFGQLTHLHYTAFGGEDKEIIHLSAAVELLALSFDILDDLEDLDNFEEPWMKVNPSLSLNAATAMYTISLQMLHELSSEHKWKIISTFQRFALQAMEGQHIDLQNEISTEDECISMIEKKSGSLIALASLTGAMLADGVGLDCIEKYSYQIGLAAQIENDYRDLFHVHKNDLASQKKSLVLLYLNRGFNDHAIELSEFISSQQGFADHFGSIEAFKSKLLQSGVIHYLNVMKQIAIQKATSILGDLPLNENQIELLKSHLIINQNER